MTGWVAEFRRSLEAEFGERPAVVALATADGGAPRVRYVVVRRVERDGALWIAADARGAKVEQLAARPVAEVAAWLPTLRRQYRIAGAVEVVRGRDRRARRCWEGLSPASRAPFAWPAPGAPRTRDPAAFPALWPEGRGRPASFVLLVVRPDRAERLDLDPHPHRRTRWLRAAGASGWAEEQLNP